MPDDHTPPRERTDRRGVVVLVLALGLIAVAALAGITGGGSPDAAGAAAWVARERPVGPVVTVDEWGSALGDDGRLRVVTAAEGDLDRVAAATGAGSVVAPAGASAAERLAATGEWTVSYRDGAATVLVHDGALPVPGAP